LLSFSNNNNKEKVSEHLIKARANIFQKDNQANTTLHLASAKGNVPVTVFLLAYKVDPKSINSSKETPLHNAARNGHLQVHMATFFVLIT
jgi:ankyrin repeat protein